MAENRSRILDEASRLFRAKGFDSVSVVEVMKAAGFTHGGFYSHFSSKDDLIAQSVAHALARDAGGAEDIHSYMDAYLSPCHRDNAGDGCPTAGLAADMRRQAVAARMAMSDGLQSQIDHISAALPGGSRADRRRNAIGSWAAMVGAVILARAIDDPMFSGEVLEQTRKWIDVQIDQTSAIP
ncbi:MAG TPA: helix-turn-helix domain-containing protein [Burkholderiales bacterium]